MDSSSQTLYAVLDRGVAGVIQRGNLLQQSVVSSTQDSRVTTAVAMAAGRSGWYIDLPGVGERLVGTPAIANGIVFFPHFSLALEMAVCQAVRIGCMGSMHCLGLRSCLASGRGQ